MPRRVTPMSGDQFAQKLRSLRLKIDVLPFKHRPHLYELADAIAKQHDRLQNKERGSDEPK